MADPRLTLMRDGVAAASLQGLVAADRYGATTAMHCVAPVAAIRKAASASAEQLDQLLFGEVLDVLQTKDGFCLGQARRDGYVGYVAASALEAGIIEPTHWVSALRAYAFSEPDLKAPPVALLTMNSLVHVEGRHDRYLNSQGAGWIADVQLTPIGEALSDPVTVAQRFLGAPYQWGGRESAGLDCSGLVQQALYAAGRAAPRDSDMQMTLGEDVAISLLRRGDLVFWRGHVGMMTDATTLLHANAYHMMVALEPLAEAISRNGAPLALRRI